jgi:hypothetical protein
MSSPPRTPCRSTRHWSGLGGSESGRSGSSSGGCWTWPPHSVAPTPQCYLDAARRRSSS